MPYKGIGVKEIQQIKTSTLSRAWVFMPDILSKRKLPDLKNTWKNVLSETEKITKHEVFKGNKLVTLEIMASHSLEKFVKTKTIGKNYIRKIKPTVICLHVHPYRFHSHVFPRLRKGCAM